jgi:hypothetical protein
MSICFGIVEITLLLVLMRALLSITKEKEWISQLGSVFPEFNLQIHVTSEVTTSLLAKDIGHWSAIVLDLDALSGLPEEVLETAKQVASLKPPVIVIVPVGLLSLVTDLRQAGMYILHKPASAGEVGLALGRILKQG